MHHLLYNSIPHHAKDERHNRTDTFIVPRNYPTSLKLSLCRQETKASLSDQNGTPDLAVQMGSAIVLH
jgi:hypothetical protein